jgi:hypothetical protein
MELRQVAMPAERSVIVVSDSHRRTVQVIKLPRFSRLNATCKACHVKFCD